MIRFAFAMMLFGSVAAKAQSIDVAPPGPVLAGDAVSIKLAGMPANSNVTVSAQRLLNSGAKRVLYRAEAVYETGADGSLDMSAAMPSSGSYRGADVRGLFWSMVPSQATPPAELAPEQVLLVAQVDGKTVAKTIVQFVNTLPSVKVEVVDAFPGAVLAMMPGAQRQPVVIVLGGSEGGASAVRQMALNLGARGFAALGLPYYSPAAWSSPVRELPSLPQSFVDIPVDRLQAVHAWLLKRGDVDASRIGVLGVSKGAEFALIAASKMPWIRSVAAIVPSDVVWQGWGPDVIPPDSMRSSFSFGGKALPFVPNKDFFEEMAGFRTGADVRYRRAYDKGRAAFPAAAVAARIRVEDFKGPLLVAGGIEDQMWASGAMVQNIVERRVEAKLETVALIFTDAGHMLSGTGWSPTTQYDAGPFKTGGTPAANAKAQAEVWQATLSFLARTLASGSAGLPVLKNKQVQRPAGQALPLKRNTQLAV